jgi:hypothetical protein
MDLMTSAVICVLRLGELSTAPSQYLLHAGITNPQAYDMLLLLLAVLQYTGPLAVSRWCLSAGCNLLQLYASLGVKLASLPIRTLMHDTLCMGVGGKALTWKQSQALECLKAVIILRNVCVVCLYYQAALTLSTGQ